MFDPFSSHETGQFPLAIATSLALEGALGIYPERETNINQLTRYSELWVNLRTLYRNLYYSVPTETQLSLTADSIMNALIREVEMLESVVLEKTALSMKIVLYVSNYKDMARKYPKAKVREPKTDKQRMYDHLQRLAISSALKELGQQGGRDVRVFERKLVSPNPSVTYGKSLILTHYAYDLLSRKYFSDLDLLESHTGTIKSRATWYTKYYEGRALAAIPFREDLLQIFGDSETFAPWHVKERNQLIALAEDRKWTATTTVAKIRSDLDHLANPYLHAQVASLLLGI